MPASTESRSGLKYGWSLGENGWKDDMDNNLLSVGRFAYHLSVKDRDLATPPGSPAQGDSYIVAAAPTGAWVGKPGQIALWNGTAWVFGVPREGWRTWIDDEDLTAVFNGASWVVQAGAGTVTSVGVTAPASGITVSGGPVTTAGSITLALANDLAALEALASTGVPNRTGADTWTQLAVDSSTALGASNTTLPTQGAVKGYVDAKRVQVIPIACSDETTALTAGTAKVTFRMPFAFTLTAVRASLTTAQTSGAVFTVDINEAGVSILSTKLTIDNTEKSSVTAATAPVMSDTALADDAEITIDIDQVGDGTAKGLKVYLIGVVT